MLGSPRHCGTEINVICSTTKTEKEKHACHHCLLEQDVRQGSSEPYLHVFRLTDSMITKPIIFVFSTRMMHLFFVTLLRLLLLLLAAIPCVSFTVCRSSTGSMAWERYHSHSHHDHDDIHDNDALVVGDYVKGLHGGKYQFDQDNVGISMESQQFVEELYGGGNEGTEDMVKTIPEWAMNIVLPDNETEDNYDVIEFGDDEFPSLYIENEEPTWGKYFAQVQHATLKDAPFYVDPCQGELAPRTGSVDISIQPIEEYTIDDGWWLILSTEEMHMYYKLVKS